MGRCGRRHVLIGVGCAVCALCVDCCRVCPQNHLLEIDQLFGATPPPIRRYDDADPVARSFIQAVANEHMEAESNSGSNCCNVCPTGQNGGAAGAADSAPKGAAGVRRAGIAAPLSNLQFTSRRVPLPPCCPYCREQHLDEPYSDVVRPEKLRGLPARRVASALARNTVLLEVGQTQTFMREYAYAPTTPETCCNRCLRAPTATEEKTAAGENLWPLNPTKTTTEAAASEADQEGAPDIKELAEEEKALEADLNSEEEAPQEEAAEAETEEAADESAE